MKKVQDHELNNELAKKAIDTVKKALPLFKAGIPLVRKGPGGETEINIPVMYMNYAVDRIHYDPYRNAPSPKGRPVRIWNMQVNMEEVEKIAGCILKELHVVEAVEFREPENAWVVPVAWKNFLILHVKVSSDGESIIPDYPLTEEVRRNV